MNSKNILVTKASMPSMEEYFDEIKRIWDTSWMTNMGELHNSLEKKLLEYLDVDNISLFTNGHLALELLLQAMNLKGEVITTPFTFVSTTHAIIRNGLTPVFCDINIDDYTIDVSKIESLITDKTCAILPVHVYGNICDVEQINRIAKKYDIKVIYDAAHAFGEQFDKVGIGNFGDASMFSFHATKVFNTIEGGAITFSNKEIGKELYTLKNFGIKSETIVDGIGCNAKMNEFQAAMGICNLRHVEEEIGKRKTLVERYRKWLSGIDGIKILKENEKVKYNYSYFPVVFDEKKFGYTRNDICEKLRKNNIFPRKYFYPLTSDLDCYKHTFSSSETPIAQYISKRILTLPLYGDLRLDDVDRICNIMLGND
ncbi:DegT/DnrJ/EryC1/StrS aminotransferase family protein [Clostridiales bacterium oral taxon 876 str. F0540]|nr:DegT/DnrJ/EryC1/StrS aminotransferase family protein [Clostridiales bacterium oral taxon 876 str. F0540]